MFDKISTASELGHLIRKHRKMQRYTLVELSAICHISVRFISELENGRSTCSIGRILIIMQRLNINLYSQADSELKSTRPTALSESELS